MVLITGDVHANFGHLNTLINKKSPDMVICCGDFGYWPDHLPFNIKPKNTKIYWCDGNHEQHDRLTSLVTQHGRIPIEIIPNVFYMPRSSTLILPDGRTILFMGGAYSVDKNQRTPGYDWFPEEEIQQRDMMNLPDWKVDIVISHTCPKEFTIDRSQFVHQKYNDSSRIALSQILNLYKPKLWYFGHFHKYMSGLYQETQWRCLSMVPETNWWVDLSPL